jgi:hypothetical protein
MATLERDITIPQGATFRYVWQLTGPNLPADISGYTARMMIRPWRESEEVYADWSSEIIVQNETKQVVITVPDTDTAALDFTYGRYDIEMVGGGSVFRLAEGTAYLDKEVTRP